MREFETDVFEQVAIAAAAVVQPAVQTAVTHAELRGDGRHRRRAAGDHRADQVGQKHAYPGVAGLRIGGEPESAGHGGTSNPEKKVVVLAVAADRESTRLKLSP